MCVAQLMLGCQAFRQAVSSDFPPPRCDGWRAAVLGGGALGQTVVRAGELVARGDRRAYPAQQATITRLLVRCLPRKKRGVKAT